MSHILISGVGRGIGRAMAKEALSRGHHVIGTARKIEDLSALTGRAFTPLIMDVTEPETIRKAANAYKGVVDILINNAGIIGPMGSPAGNIDFEFFLDTLTINSLGPLRVTQAFLPHIRQSEAGRIVTISSLMGSLSHAKSDRIAYRASKAAVNKIMQGFATDLQGEGIAAISVHPGWVRTDMGGSSADISPEQSAKGIIDLAERLTMKQSGRFWNWDGKELAW